MADEASNLAASSHSHGEAAVAAAAAAAAAAVAAVDCMDGLSTPLRPRHDSSNRRLSVNTVSTKFPRHPDESGSSCNFLRALASTMAVVELAGVVVLWLAAFSFDLCALLRTDVVRFAVSQSLFDVVVASASGLVVTLVACYCCWETARRPRVAGPLLLLGAALRVLKLLLIATDSSGGGSGAAEYPVRFQLSLIAVGSSTVSSLVGGCALLYVGGLQMPVFTLCRTIFSTTLTAAAAGVIGYGVLRRESVLPGPPWLLLVIFAAATLVLWHLEGVQVAILQVEGAPVDTFVRHPRAGKLQRLVQANGGQNLKRFLVGRQFFVIFVVYLTAQITTFPTLGLPLPYVVEVVLIDTGLPGVLVVMAVGQVLTPTLRMPAASSSAAVPANQQERLVCAAVPLQSLQLMPQLMAATDPRWFMQLPLSYPTVLLCLGFEWIGITRALTFEHANRHLIAVSGL